MSEQEKKCVMVLDEALPAGVLANTAGILGITLGKHLPEVVGADVTDRSGRVHLGIIAIPIPILKAARERLREIREALWQPEYEAVLAVDFSDVTQSCNVYDVFTQRAAQVESARFHYMGLGICGPKKLVNRLTGNLPLLR